MHSRLCESMHVQFLRSGVPYTQLPMRIYQAHTAFQHRERIDLPRRHSRSGVYLGQHSQGEARSCVVGGERRDTAH